MLKEAATAAGAAIVLSPLGIPIAAHGLAGLIVGNAGLYLVDVFLKDIRVAFDNSESERLEKLGRCDAERD